MRALQAIIVRDRRQRRPRESRSAQARRLGYSEGALRCWELGTGAIPLSKRAYVARSLTITERALNAAIEKDAGRRVAKASA